MKFLDELLNQEGYLCLDSLDLNACGDLAAALDGHAVAIVAAESLSQNEAESIARFIRSGGCAMLVQPPPSLIDALGLSVRQRPGATYATAPVGYVQFAEHPWSALHAGVCIQCHVPVWLWRLDGVRPLARVAICKDAASPYEAIVEGPCGDGHVTIFWFDVGSSVVLTRQGNPNLASDGPEPDADGDGMFKAAGLFHTHLDYSLREVPQADVIADVIVAAIRGMTDSRLSLPRLWHLPADAPALTLLDGDSDGFLWDNYDRLVSRCAAAKVAYTLNLLTEDLPKLGGREPTRLFDSGNDVELHYWLGDVRATPADAARFLPEQHRRFEEAIGRPSVGGRSHCGIWPGYTEMASILSEQGCLMDTSFFAFRGCQWGYLNGSGRAARFMTGDGRLLQVRQQGTQFMDDCIYSEKSLLPVMTADQAYQQVTRLYARAVERHHGAINTCIHAGEHHMRTYGDCQLALLQGVLDATAKYSLPALSIRAWAGFLQARQKADLRYVDGKWQLHTDAPISALTVHVPSAAGSRRNGLTWRAMTRDYGANETFNLDSET
jgi:hypothetical protein